MRRVAQASMALGAGLLLQIGGLSCTGLGEKVIKSVNPCGTVLNCDPAEYDLLTTDFPDWNIDPSCTIPGQCGAVEMFPLGSGGGATTTNNN